MPSIGHVALGLAAGRFHAGLDRPRLGPTLALTALATFPDADVLASTLGATRASEWFHRGASHSLLVAAAAGTLAALLLGGLGRSRLRLAVTGALAAASHGLLDTLTRGGNGVMLLWPFSDERFHAPFALVAAAPMGARLASWRGLEVMLAELVLFAPLIAYAAWPRGRGAAARGGAASPG